MRALGGDFYDFMSLPHDGRSMKPGWKVGLPIGTTGYTVEPKAECAVILEGCVGARQCQGIAGHATESFAGQQKQIRLSGSSLRSRQDLRGIGNGLVV